MKIQFTSVLKAALASGAIAAVLNLIYLFAYKAATGINAPVINTGSVTGASIVPLLVAGVVFFFLAGKLKNGKTIYTVMAIVLGLLSLGGSFQSQLPDGSAAPGGFALLTAPMHLIAAAAAAFGIPYFTNTFSK
ncbi:MAG: hypothetical protein K2X48_02545 [Chitinophagaceae bacterium]|nr:hypothetical protein [Chitinophagaceae bacterium]